MANSDISQFIIDVPRADAPAGAPTDAPPPVAYAAAAPACGNGALNAVATAILVFLVIVLIVYLLTPHSLANKLARQGWVLYVQPGCPHCTRQQRILGTDNYRKKVVCVRAGRRGGIAIESSTLAETRAPYLCSRIQAYPFWVNQYTQEVRRGTQNAEQLEDML